MFKDYDIVIRYYDNDSEVLTRRVRVGGDCVDAEALELAPNDDAIFYYYETLEELLQNKALDFEVVAIERVETETLKTRLANCELFIETVYEIAFGADAIDRDFSKFEVIEQLTRISNEAQNYADLIEFINDREGSKNEQ